MENAYTHTWMSYLVVHNFHFPLRYLGVQVAFRAEMAVQAEVPPVLVEVLRFACASSVSADSVLYVFAMEGSCPCDFFKQ